MSIHESGQMYLETIYILSQNKSYVRAIDVGEHLGYSKPSVSRAMSILKKDGYVLVDTDGAITLTESGMEVAQTMYTRHIVLLLCGAIADTLGTIDPEHQDAYAENAAAYIGKLTDLDGQYQAAVDAASTHTLLFADRFPFRYLADDYGLTYYAAFSGCSAETEASFETVAFLAGKVDELSLPCVLTIEGPPIRSPRRWWAIPAPKTRRSWCWIPCSR